MNKSNSQDEIIFEGKNNLFELVLKNSAYFDATHDVIIIKGDNTIIKLININIIDLTSGSTDTLIIVGNSEKYVMDVSNSILTKKGLSKTDTVYLKEPTIDVTLYAQESIENDRAIRLDYFDSLVSPKYAYLYFLDRLKTGEPKYFHELGEMYLYGLGVKESTTKALELYEYSAARNYIPSLIKLGDIYKGRFSIRRDKNKSLYFFKRCQALGDSYCDEQVKNALDN